MCSVVILVICLISGSWCVEQLRFPPGFYFGVSTSAGQVEGAWNISGKSESVYDHFTHTQPEMIADGSDTDVACDSYHLWRRDIQMLEELGVNMYRFSISWTRLLPSGFPNYINPDGVRYYSDLIDALLERGIEPLVTIYHFDQPQSIQDLGGWANPLVVDWFADYARVVYTLFADRVKYWVTINEPFGVCDGEYAGIHAPAFDDKKIGRFLCNKYVLMAHAAAWRIYDEEFKPKYHGKVSVTSIFNWFVRRTPNDTVTELATEFWEGRYNHPIFSKQGGWPPRIEKLLAENAKKEGYPQPRLPPFTPEEIEFVKGTYDYYGLNHYSSKLVRKARPGEKIGAWPSYGSDEIGIVLENDPAWEITDIDWFPVYPEGLRQHLHWLNETYGPIDILIGENGYPSLDTGLQDKKRLNYIQSYLEQLLLAMKDGISVIGYNVWSLMDNFEWRGGYTIRFGLYAVNFSDPLRERTARDSAKYYASVIRSRAVHSTHDDLYEI